MTSTKQSRLSGDPPLPVGAGPGSERTGAEASRRGSAEAGDAPAFSTLWDLAVKADHTEKLYADWKGNLGRDEPSCDGSSP